jgi:hypothetical protein
MLVTSPRYAAGRGQNSDSAPPVPEWMLGAMDMEQRQRLSQDIAKYGNDAQKAQLPLAAPYTKE